VLARDLALFRQPLHRAGGDVEHRGRLVSRERAFGLVGDGRTRGGALEQYAGLEARVQDGEIGAERFLGAVARSCRRLTALSDTSGGNSGKESDAATPRGGRWFPLATRRLPPVRPFQYVQRPHLHRSPGSGSVPTPAHVERECCMASR
jgi:hypothetical protein